jgi:hypothetical protein
MRFACWITKATDTNSEYVILIAFPHQKWLRERALILRFTYIVYLVTPSYFITVVGKRWSLTSVQSGDFIAINVLSEFLFQSSKILDFRKSNQFLLKSSAFHGLRRVSISGAICLFPVQLISHAAASQSFVAAGPYVIRFTASLHTHGGRKVGSQSSTA